MKALFLDVFFFFCGRRCFSEVSHPQQYSIATRDTVVPMNIEVPAKYPLSQNDRIVVLEIRLHSENPMLYRPALHGNWNVLSLATRALKDKFPTPIPLTAVLPKSSGISAGPCIWIMRIYFKWSQDVTSSLHNLLILIAPQVARGTTLNNHKSMLANVVACSMRMCRH